MTRAMLKAMAATRSSTNVTTDLLLRAYSIGLFPMAEAAEDERVFWVDPEKRGVFPLHAVTISSSLAKAVRSDRFTVVADKDFDAVIDGCARGGRAVRFDTWINARIRRLFQELFDSGTAHSIEAYRDGLLVGGLYGLQIGSAFFGESMFHSETDASKVCFVHLAARLKAGGFTLLDAQFITPHLARLGAIEIPRADYQRRLAAAVSRNASFRLSGAGNVYTGREALETLHSASA